MDRDAEQAAAGRALLPGDDILRKHKSWFTGLAGLAERNGHAGEGACGRMQREVVAEISAAPDDARASFMAALAARREAKGRVTEADMRLALDDMRAFQRAVDAGAGRFGRWVHRQAEEFKAFVSRGNVVELAIGMVMAEVFNDVIKSFVAAFLTPSLTLITGSSEDEVAQLSFSIAGVPYPYGAFISDVISFFLSAIFLYFAVMKPYTTIVRRWENAQVFHSIAEVVRESEEEKLTEDNKKKVTKECEECLSEIPLLAKRCKFCTATQPPPPGGQ